MRDLFTALENFDAPAVSRHLQALTPEGKSSLPVRPLEEDADAYLRHIWQSFALQDVLRWVKWPTLLPHLDAGNGFLALSHACETGCLDIVKTLLERGVPVETPHEVYGQPLHHAAAKGHVEIAKLLMKHGADINALNHVGCTPLFEATQGSEASTIEVLQLLLEAGADPNRTGEHLMSPLGAMCWLPFESGVEKTGLLVSFGADMDRGDPSPRHQLLNPAMDVDPAVLPLYWKAIEKGLVEWQHRQLQQNSPSVSSFRNKARL